MCVCIYIYIYIYIYTDISLYLSLYIYIYLSIYLSLSLYIYIYICIHTYTYTYNGIHVPPCAYPSGTWYQYKFRAKPGDKFKYRWSTDIRKGKKGAWTKGGNLK